MLVVLQKKGMENTRTQATHARYLCQHASRAAEWPLGLGLATAGLATACSPPHPDQWSASVVTLNQPAASVVVLLSLFLSAQKSFLASPCLLLLHGISSQHILPPPGMQQAGSPAPPLPMAPPILQGVGRQGDLLPQRAGNSHDVLQQFPPACIS